MNLKQIIINICITFTLLTMYDLIMNIIRSKDINVYDTLIHLVLCIIAYSSMIIFNYLKQLPLRITQIIHYLTTILVITLLLVIMNQFNPLTDKFLLNLYIIYLIIVIVYEVNYRIKIKNHNLLLKKIKK